MKIINEKLKAFSTEITPECQRVITNMKNTGDTGKFVSSLDMMTEWCSTFGKTEMGRWADVLNDCDVILETALNEDENGTFAVDRDESLEAPVLSVLRFTSLLFENTFSRSIYASMERLIKLLDCRKMWVLVQVLRLLMIISKSSRFISQHITQEARGKLYTKLMAILETWSGRLRTLPVNEFCSDTYAVSTPTLVIQIRSDVPGYTVNLDKPISKSISEMNGAFSSITLDEAEKALASFKVRFAYSSKNWNERFYLMMARLIATSVFFYSRCLITEEWRLNSLANDRFIEYCCEILRCELPSKCHALLDAVKTEALKTLASVVFLEKDKKIQIIVDNLELRTYHGFLPSQIRSCIDSLKAGRVDGGGDCSIAFVTSLFSLIYHIAGFEYGGDALNRSSMTAVLLDVVQNYTLSEQNISFVTRSVRIIDNLTGMDITEFNARSGTEIVIKRLIHEVNKCKTHMHIHQQSSSSSPILCNQQRSALMKSLLNFLKRAVVDVHLASQMRRIMDTDLPFSLTHIIEHPQYYGPSLLHCAVTLATNFIFQEPAQLATLQNKGLTNAIMGLIFSEKFPISRDLVCALPNVCSALCLNERGLNELKMFDGNKPLEKMFRIIFSNKFLQSMRKRKIEIIETAHMLGTSFDELIRHHPSLRKDLMGTLATLCDDWLSFEQNEEEGGKHRAISWAVGKSVVEDESALVLPLGDFSTMIGIMLETMLTNRGVQENVNVANEFEISLRLVKLITQAKQPSPIIMQSNYLHMLANILRYTHKHDMDKAFLHLIERSKIELVTYKQAEIMEDVNSQQRLCQLTRLCALLIILNSLMKSSLHSQGTHEMRPYMLKYFATDSNACAFIYALFKAYKIIGTDRLVIMCNANAAEQQQTTSSQIAEDTAKVRELLINDESSSSSRQHGTTSITTPTMMEVDNPDTLSSSSLPQQQQQMRPVDFVITTTGTVVRSNSNSTVNTIVGPTALMRSSSTIAPMSSADGGRIVERSTHSVAIRTLKQIAELITYIGKAFCTFSFPRIRQRGNAPPPIDQTTMRQYAQNITKFVFTGLKLLLERDDVSSVSKTLCPGLSSSHIHHSLSTLKKLLIDDTQNLSLLLPYFYKTGCHNAFFALGNYLRLNIDKVEFNMPTQVWLGITQRLIAVQLQDTTNKSKGLQQAKQQQTVVVDGFESYNYLATFQKDAFAALINIFKSVIKLLSSESVPPMLAMTMPDNKEEEAFILLERVLCSMKVLVQGMMELLELNEGKIESSPEIPLSEIDPRKIEQLVEMGFSQSDAVDALMQYSSVHEAAEYIVSSSAGASRPHTTAVEPTVTVSSTVSPTTTVAAATTVATNLVAAATAEVVAAAPDDYIGEQGQPPASTNNTPMEQEQQPHHEQQLTTEIAIQQRNQQRVEAVVEQLLQANRGESVQSETMAAVEQDKISFEELKPLKREEFQGIIDLLCREVVDICLRLVRRSRLVVLGLTELVSVFASDALASSWVDGKFIGNIITELNQHLDELAVSKTKCDDSELSEISSTDEHSRNSKDVGTENDLVEQLTSLLQLFCQLWQHFPNQKIFKRVERITEKTNGT